MEEESEQETELVSEDSRMECLAKVIKFAEARLWIFWLWHRIPCLEKKLTWFVYVDKV